MIDKDKIPEPTYRELIDLFGHEKAEEILNEKQYNFRAIQYRILSEKIKRNFTKKQKLYMFLIIVVIWILYETLKY